MLSSLSAAVGGRNGFGESVYGVATAKSWDRYGSHPVTRIDCFNFCEIFSLIGGQDFVQYHILAHPINS